MLTNENKNLLMKIKDILIQEVPKTTDIIQIYRLLQDNNYSEYKCSVLKEPRWVDDAFIVKISDSNSSDFTLKIHYDKYPMASHVYNSPHLLSKLERCLFSTTIVETFIIPNGHLNNIRFVFYEYIDGIPLDKLVVGASGEMIATYRELLKECVENLFKIGFNPFIRDLGDFILVEESGIQRVILTDYNTLVDCSNSHSHAREEIMDIIEYIIYKTVSSDYRPFISERPTMFQLD
ncbi:hypothetical protein P4S75_13445 [Anoxybacillus ayderensis]|uniref:hypothetical protein n=1 Tax=Anoxybacillus ayderensis TaxID=265546 RepID=UPI002E1F595B|nr:hypothetical protein [Anoxybacillus ayderensis]